MRTPIRPILAATLLATTWAGSAAGIEIYSDPSRGQRVDLGGQLRLRGNSLNNLDFTSTVGDGETFVEQRLRFDFTAHASETAFGYIQIQDSRIWGQENPTDPTGATLTSTENLDLHQAFFQVGSLFGGPGASLRAGRFSMSYGSGRIVGEEDWSNVGRAFDGVRLQLAPNPAYDLDLFYAKVVERDDRSVGGTDNDVNFYGAVASLEPSQEWDWQAWFFYNRDVDPTLPATNAGRREELFTTGARFDGGSTHWFFDVEGSLQWGNVPVFSAADSLYVGADHGAYAFATRVDYHGRGPLAPTFGFGYDKGSGDDTPGDLESKTWVQMYPTIHDSYGSMDLVSWPNTSDLHTHALLAPTYRTTFGADYHIFKLSQAPGSKDLGRELDLTLSYLHSEQWSLRIGYSMFFAGQVLDEMVAASNPGVTAADDSRYFYLLTAFGW